MPRVRVISVQRLLEAAGFPGSQIAGLVARTFRGAGHWTVCTPIGEGEVDEKASKLLKSIRKHVDDDEKRSNFLVMLTALWRAAEQQDYGAVLANSTVTPKPAHSFLFQGKRHTVLELKQGKKDRLYFFSAGLAGRACLVLLLAHHKKDQTTPREVSQHCELTMKVFIAAAVRVEFT
jgi:hypothetical protein